jgi:hypothetical protein
VLGIVSDVLRQRWTFDEVESRNHLEQGQARQLWMLRGIDESRSHSKQVQETHLRLWTVTVELRIGGRFGKEDLWENLLATGEVVVEQVVGGSRRRV